MFPKRVKWIFVGLLLAPSIPAFADWAGPFPVNYIESSSGNIYFMLDWTGATNYPTTVTGCVNTTVYFPAATLTTQDLQRALSIGLTAQASGLKVRFFITGCNNYLTANAIAIDTAW